MQKISFTQHPPRRQTWTCKSRHRSSLVISRWYSLHQKRRQRISKALPYHTRRTTISTLTTTSTKSYSNNVTLIEQHQQVLCFYPSIFNTQSILFLFGFLFFPFWQVGGYYLKEPNEMMDVEQTWVTVYPSLLANGKTSNKIFWLSNVQQARQNESMLFYRWNRLMSLVSIGLVILVIGLFIWYFIQYT